jgi:hypothetical protein
VTHYCVIISRLFLVIVRSESVITYRVVRRIHLSNSNVPRTVTDVLSKLAFDCKVDCIITSVTSIFAQDYLRIVLLPAHVKMGLLCA